MPNCDLSAYCCSHCESGWKGIAAYGERFLEDEQQWVYRGQENLQWGLLSTLDRQIQLCGVPTEKASQLERGLIRKFRRHCHQYLSDTPQDDNYLEWLALMRHHGAPTRLLDWTYSFYVALFFAIESVRFPDKGESCDERACAAVWALNLDKLRRPVESILRRHAPLWKYWTRDDDTSEAETFNKVFMAKAGVAFVGAVTPYRLNQRLGLQQGTFLCPGDPTYTFEENLLAVLKEENAKCHDYFRSLAICINREGRREILRRLLSMNVHRATLFPGLDGFAQSLRTLIPFRETHLAPADEGP